MALDPNRPIDGNGPDQVFGTDPSAARTVADGATTNASKTVTSATAAFTTSDIGHIIVGSGIPAQAIITDVASATSVTISLAATATATGVTITIGGHYPGAKLASTEYVFGQTPILPPVQAALVGAGTGGTLAAATYYYVVTAVGNGANAGETTKSNERSATVSGSTSKITVSWAASTGASAYKIYRATTTGSEVLLTTVTGATSYVDTGAATPGTATPPTTNNAVFYSPTAQFQAQENQTTGYDAGYTLGAQQVAAPNTRSVADGVTNSTTLVTSATAAFTSGDRGAPIRGGTIPANTYIKVVNSATSVTLSAAASGSASGVTLTIGGVFQDANGYGYGIYPSGPDYTGTTNGAGAGYAVVPGDTTGITGHAASFGSSATYGQSLLTAGDQQFGAQTKDAPITGSPDTLGNSGGTAGEATYILPAGYAHNVGDPLGNNQNVFGSPLFVASGFDTPSAAGDRTTTNDLFRSGITQNDGSVGTTLPTSYTLSVADTLYGYTGLTAGSTGSAPTKPQSVSWAYGVGCAVVSWAAPSSTGGNTIREYTVVGYRVKDDTYIPLSNGAADAFAAEPSVTWKGHGGTFLSPPVQAAIVGSTSGGTLAAATRFYVVTALGVNGETIRSNERSVVNTGSTSSNAISWAAVTGAVSYNVYRSTATGTEVFLKNVTGTTYTDTNADTATTATPPSASTAVTPTTTARLEHLTPGEHYFFRVYCRNDVGTSPMSDAVAGPASPNNVPKYFMGLGMSGTTNSEMDEASLLSAEFLADRL